MITEKEYLDLLKSNHLQRMDYFNRKQHELAEQRKQFIDEYKAERKRIYEESNKPTPESWVRRQTRHAHNILRVLASVLREHDHSKNHFAPLQEDTGFIQFEINEEQCIFTIKFDLLKFEQK